MIFEGVLQGAECKDHYSPIFRISYFEESNYSHLFWHLPIPMVPSMWSFCKFWLFSSYTQIDSTKGILETSDPKIACYFMDNSKICNDGVEQL